MKTHDTFLQLAAIAIDFPLDGAERRRLDEHLRVCQSCARTAMMLRQDAVALTHLPPAYLPQRRGAEIFSVALHPAPVRVTGRALVIAVVLGLLLMGSFVVGAGLLRLLQSDDLAVMPPVPSPSPTPEASGPTSSPMPGAPTGTVAVTRLEDGLRWIELMTMDGVSTRLALGRDPAWLSPDRIVYTCPEGAVEGEQDTGICAIDVNPPGDPELLMSSADHPVPSPDGRLIAFHRGIIDVGETWVMAADGANPRLVHTGAFDRWSPDGVWLAGQPESANVEIAVVGVDGHGFQVLVPGYDPAWSPTGDRITYAVVDEAGASIRNVFPHDGEIEPLVTEPADTSLSAPAWVANGRRLYVRNSNLWMFDSAESRTLQVTDDLAIPGGTASDPLAVSPDGAWVAFTNGAGDAARVELVRYDGSDRTTLPWAGPVMQPAWAPAATPASPTPTPAPSPVGTTSPTPEPLGTTWSDAQMPVVVGRPLGTVEAVTAGGPGFVAVGRGCIDTGGDLPTCEGVVWTSVDGTTWVRAPAQDPTETGAYFSSSGPEIGMFDVAAGGPGIVVIGYAARPDMAVTIWFSEDDGVSWERNAMEFAGMFRVNAITWDGTRFVMVGEDRSEWDGTLKGMAKATARAAVWISTDGYNFDRVPYAEVFDVGDFLDTMEDPMTGGMTDVVMGPAGLVAVGSVCTAEPRGCVPMAWTSPDGITWERASAMHAEDDPREFASGLAVVAASDGGYVAAGGGHTFASADGRTWEWTGQIGILKDVAMVGEQLFGIEECSPGSVEVVRLDDRGNLIVTTDKYGNTWSDQVEIGDRLPGSICEPVEWHFAAKPGVAVAVGPVSETGEPRAAFSVGE